MTRPEEYAANLERLAAKREWHEAEGRAVSLWDYWQSAHRAWIQEVER